MLRDELVSQSDLLEAIKEALERKGVYPKLKSQLRAEVYHTLEDKSFISSDTNITEKPRDVYLASELIRELLMSFGLNNSLSVFSEEMGQPAQMAVDREFIASEMGLNARGTDTRVPLLILIIQHLAKQKEDALAQMNESMVVNTDD